MFGVMILCVCVKHPPPFFDYYCLLSGPVLWAHIPTSVAVRKFEMNLPMYVILLFSLLFRIRVRLIAHASRSSPCESSSCTAHSSFNRLVLVLFGISYMQMGDRSIHSRRFEICGYVLDIARDDDGSRMIYVEEEWWWWWWWWLSDFVLQVFHAEEAFDVLKDDENEESLRAQTLDIQRRKKKSDSSEKEGYVR